MADMDERILRAITGSSGCESHLEPGDRRNPGDTGESDHSHDSEDSDANSRGRHRDVPPADTAANRALSDAALRQHLSLGGAKTGPKGVIADRKFHERQERARREIKTRRDWDRADGKGLSSGWVARQVAADAAAAAAGEDDDDDANEEDDQEDAAYLDSYRAKRLAQLAHAAHAPRFGSVITLDTSDAYLQAIDDAPPATLVIIHLYDHRIEPCRLVDALLVQLASRRPAVKFCRIEAGVADETFDRIALPALIAYRAGETVATAMRVLDEVDGWKRTGRCDVEELESALVAGGMLGEDGDDAMPEQRGINAAIGGLCIGGHSTI
ncbi:hypothetical protein HDU87_004859 [Geranomyces variabilis]|uniref:Phosducin domain-containing protein n=1 Tax=Geranomyces variabilis TaxID=109894 RepID=A0AAD5TK43_9FUNG|nr:hypothetical protein HDU87_004859 [Geranomyces variabilis]